MKWILILAMLCWSILLRSGWQNGLRFYPRSEGWEDFGSEYELSAQERINHVASNPYFAYCIRYRWHRVHCDYFNWRLRIPKRRWRWSRWRSPRWCLSRWRLPWCSRTPWSGGGRRSCCGRCWCRRSLRSLSLRILSVPTVLVGLWRRLSSARWPPRLSSQTVPVFPCRNGLSAQCHLVANSGGAARWEPLIRPPSTLDQSGPPHGRCLARPWWSRRAAVLSRIWGLPVTESVVLPPDLRGLHHDQEKNYWAEVARAIWGREEEAAKLPYGKLKNRPLQKARQLHTASQISQWLASPAAQVTNKSSHFRIGGNG